MRIDFRAAPRTPINPFQPSSWPQLEVDVGTFWGLLVLSLAYVHHSTTGCDIFPHPWADVSGMMCAVWRACSYWTPGSPGTCLICKGPKSTLYMERGK